MKFIFLMDPLSQIRIDKDTTFALMLAAHQKGHQVYYLPKNGLVLERGRVRFRVAEVVPQIQKACPFLIGEAVVLNENQADVLFIRTDPPFDYQYLMHTWMLERAANSIVMINAPLGIRCANEKIWASQFSEIVPPTMVSRSREELLGFACCYDRVVIKPTDGFGGQSVFALSRHDPNLLVALETLSNQFSTEIVIQEFIPAADDGDKRILLLDGEPLGAVLRVHAPGEHRNNFFAGGQAVATSVTDRDKFIINTIASELKRLGLAFVGIDILGDYLIEVNVTSPTCLQEMNRLYGEKLEDRVIEYAQERSRQYKK